MAGISRTCTIGRGIRPAIIRALVVLAVGSVPAAAVAQGGGQRGGFGGGGGFGGQMGMMGDMGGANRISTAQIDKMITMLGVSSDQAQVIRTLHEGYDAEVRALADSVREQMRQVRERFQEDRDPSVWQSMGDSMAKARDDGRRVEEDFVESVQAVLSKEQSASWDRVDRMLRRERTIRRGLLSGERMDVVRMVEQSNLPAEATAELAPVLEQYELDLDRALVERNDFQERAMEQVRELFQNRDVEAADELLARGRQLSNRVRDVNRRYARMVVDAIPDESRRAAFEAMSQRESFPDVYRQSQAERSLDAAMGFADLDPDQRQAMESLREGLARQLGPINTELARAVEAREQSMTVRDMMGMMMRGGMGDGRGRDQGDDPARELRTQKREANDQAMESLRKILRPEQVERLPREEQREGGGRQRMQERGGEDDGGRFGRERRPERT